MTRSRQGFLSGFSLMELLVAMALFSVVLTLLFGVLEGSQKMWSDTRDKLDQFEEARLAFETMTGRITDSVLTPYWGYEYPGGDHSRTPISFSRQSELHFICGSATGDSGTKPVIDSSLPPSHCIFFHGPFGLSNESEWGEYDNLLNGWGYYIDYVDRGATRPKFMPGTMNNSGFQFQLREVRISAESLQTYQESDSADWYKEAVKNQESGMVAKNVVALIISPEAPEESLNHPSDIAPDYHYDTRAYLDGQDNYATRRSRNQLPPLLRITMVVLDTPSAIRLSDSAGKSMPDLGLSGLFVDAKEFSEDLAAFEQGLLDKKLRYRVFTTVIRLRNARWSTTEEDPES